MCRTRHLSNRGRAAASRRRASSVASAAARRAAATSAPPAATARVFLSFTSTASKSGSLADATLKLPEILSRLVATAAADEYFSSISASKTCSFAYVTHASTAGRSRQLSISTATLHEESTATMVQGASLPTRNASRRSASVWGASRPAIASQHVTLSDESRSSSDSGTVSEGSVFSCRRRRRNQLATRWRLPVRVA